ncbi:MAG: methylmalonyl-CoA mutase, partial [Ignavibacteria bacterium]|nr:methylmalonyl-CoA mutase [Ignavibacteria bacterium]
FEQIDSLGGVIPAIENGYFQKEIADAAYRYQMEVERKEKFIVGVNEFVETGEKIDIPLLLVSPEVEKNQRKRLAELKQNRNQESVKENLSELKSAAMDQKNLMPPLIKAAQNYVTLGEMIGELKEVFGTYEETAVF